MTRIPLKKVKKNLKAVSLFLLLLFLTFGLNMCVSIPCKIFIFYNLVDIKNEIFFYILVFVFGLDLLCFLLAMLINPGYIEKEPNLEFMELLETFEANSLCPFCEIIRIPKSRHCNICNKCVLRFDHHCPWIGKCVGKNNLCAFYTFLFMTFGTLILCFIATLASRVSKGPNLRNETGKLTVKG